jgi:arginase/N-omega-hydroxy-L-arginine amidinohydrolase
MNIHIANVPVPQTGAGTVAGKRPFVLALRGWVCDRYTNAGMQGASLLARAAAARLHAPLRELGVPEPAMNLGWRENLAKASPYLRNVAGEVYELMRHHRLPFIFANRCGVSLATIAAMLHHRPNARIVWCDAHGDFNTPATTPTGYLGGMVLSALCGLWDSGFGAGLSPDRIVLAGARDLDPGENELIAAHGVRVIAAKDGMIDTGRVIEAIGGAPVWLHIDTDVVDPLYLPAEYRVGGGLHPAALRALLRELVRASELVGFELTEFEAPSNPGSRARAVQAVIRMIEPVFLAVPDGGRVVIDR